MKYLHLEHEHAPSGIVVPEVLRLRRMLSYYDMQHFGRYRYNMFGTAGDWFPAVMANEEAFAKLDPARFPTDIDVIGMLRETHAALLRRGKPETGH